MASGAPTYNQFDNNMVQTGQMPGILAPPNDNRWKWFGALICSILQFCLASLMLSIGIMKDALFVPTWGIHAFISAPFTILSASFGIHYCRRPDSRCAIITTMVCSGMTCLIMGSGVIVNGIFLYTEDHIEDNLQSLIDWKRVHPTDESALSIARLTLAHTIDYAAAAATGLMIFACLANSAVSFLQIVFAAATLCNCCNRPTNSNVYMANNPRPENGPQISYNVNMEHMTTNT